MSFFFFFSSRRRHTRLQGDWSSDVCSSDLLGETSVCKYEDPQAEDCGGSADSEYLRALSHSSVHGYSSSSLTKLFSESPDTQRHKHDREKEQSEEIRPKVHESAS